MSAHIKCPACQNGDHDQHVRDWHVTPGVMGGAVCPCSGGCEPKPPPAWMTWYRHDTAAGIDVRRCTEEETCPDPS